MCKSKAEGGQRCAAHTRPAYFAATVGTPEWEEAATTYASTREGEQVLVTKIEFLLTSGNQQRAGQLMASLIRGRQERDINKAVEETWRGMAAVKSDSGQAVGEVDPDDEWWSDLWD